MLGISGVTDLDWDVKWLDGGTKEAKLIGAAARCKGRDGVIESLLIPISPSRSAGGRCSDDSNRFEEPGGG